MKHFYSRVRKTRTCWLWLGGKTKAGYGTYKKTTAHRFSYQINNGIIPEGLEIDHLCNKRDCVNPKHLEAVTHSENQKRAWSRGSFKNRKVIRKTHCKNGHRFTKKSTYIQEGYRTCRICHKIREFDRRHKMLTCNAPYTSS